MNENIERLIRNKTIQLLFAVGVYALLLWGLVMAEGKAEGNSINSIWGAMWYSIVTLTTVGYGDLYPVTNLGRMIGYAFILGSLGVLGLLIGSITDAFTDMRERRKMGLLGTKFKGHVVLINWDYFGQSIVDELVGAEQEVAIVTDQKDMVDLIRERYTEKQVFVMLADYSNYNILEKINLAEASTVFINFDDDTQKLVYSLNLKKFYGGGNHVVILNNAELEVTFQTAGVTYVLSKNDMAAKIVASYIFEPDVAKYTMDLVTAAVEENDYDIQQYLVTEKNPFKDMDYIDVFQNLKKDHNIILIGISKVGPEGTHTLLKNPESGITVDVGDYLIMIMAGKNEETIHKLFGVKEGLEFRKA